MKFSLTLPSLFPAALPDCLRNIFAATRDVEYEILIVSPFEVSGRNIRWIREETPAGNCRAHRMAFDCAAGDVVVALSDDVRLCSGWDRVCARHLMERQRDRPLLVGLHQTNRMVGTVFGVYYPFFPAGLRDAILSVGGYFSDDYKAHFGDPDLALRVWSAGGRCEFTTEPVIARIERDAGATPDRTHKETSLSRDLSVFAAKWGPKFGAGWKTEALRDFNFDINPAMQLMLCRENSIYFNHPEFRTLIENYWSNIKAWDIEMRPIPQG